MIENYKNVIFWSFDLRNYRKSNWWIKTASCSIKDNITIRTANTIRKVYELASKKQIFKKILKEIINVNTIKYYNVIIKIGGYMLSSLDISVVNCFLVTAQKKQKEIMFI